MAVEDWRFVCVSNHRDHNRCNCSSEDSLRCELPCPSNCTCQSDFSISFVNFVCVDRGLRRIPTIFDYDYDTYNISTFSIVLNNNNIDRITEINFGNSSFKLKHLHVRNVHAVSIDDHAFDRLINLKTLDLSINHLEILPDEIFTKLTQLTELNLSFNRIKYIKDDTFNFLFNLNQLFLHNNLLTHLPFDKIACLRSLNALTLDGNPWPCECAFLALFRTYLSEPSAVVNNKDEINCTGNGNTLNVVRFNMEDCVSHIHLIILITSLTFASVLIAIAGIMFMWWYELQVLLYSRYHFRIFHKKQPEAEVEGKQYDAFMAYNSKDEDFLLNELMPGLEAIDNPYRLCIHERDFPAGSYIQDSILEAIRLSSRTIIILSENFVQSGWCRYEFKSAHAQMMEDRCPRVLVIVLGEVPENLDPEMQLYLKTNTYLKWGERLFWQKLYYAMPDLRVTSPPTQIMPMRIM